MLSGNKAEAWSWVGLGLPQELWGPVPLEIPPLLRLFITSQLANPPPPPRLLSPRSQGVWCHGSWPGRVREGAWSKK